MKLNQITIATAGHVDHGKTTLVKRLSGVDTDTTQEEKRRGLTINLGFTFFKLDDKTRVGIVDVPGHKKFLKNMLAGLTGIDMALLVVDVNEGVMPQTIEHANILRLLDVENFIIVLTKVKGVSQDLIDLAVEDIREHFQDDPVLAQAPIVKTDAIYDIGITDLLAEIKKMLSKIQVPKDLQRPRLNIDRVFSIKGIGTVVTGTLLEGKIHLGDNLILSPQEIQAHVKNIQVYDGDTDIALPGQRTALNINVPAKSIERGNVLSNGQGIQLTNEINVALNTLDLPDNKLEVNTRLRFYIGSEEVLGRIFPLGQNVLSGHTHGYAQIRLEKKIVSKYGDHFIVRAYSPVLTIGGGKILDEHPATRRRFDENELAKLKIYDSGQANKIVENYVQTMTDVLVDDELIAEQFNLAVQTVQQILNQFIDKGTLTKFQDKVLNVSKLKPLTHQVQTELANFHKKYPLRTGMEASYFKAKIIADIPAAQKDIVINYWLAKKYIKAVDGNYALAAFMPKVSNQDADLQNKIKQALAENGLIPLNFEEKFGEDPHIKEVVSAMAHKEIIRLNETYILSTATYQKIFSLVKQFIKQNGALSLADFRDITKTSRKYAMLVLERMDKDGLTMRVGNKRELKKGIQIK